jgi:hypothetical protein
VTVIDKADAVAIRKRTNALRDEIAQISEYNQLYCKKRRHRWLEKQSHKERISRLEEILEELVSLSRGKFARNELGPSD